jgi:hypothetical protein
VGPSTPTIQHDSGVRQRLALHPPQPGIAITQHRRRRGLVHTGRGQCPRERVRRDHRAIADEREAVLATRGVDHLAGDHFEMALLLPVTATDMAAIKPNHDGTRRLRLGLFRRLSGLLAHDLLAYSPRPVADRARMLCTTERQQFRQQHRDLAERYQHRIPGRDVR